MKICLTFNVETTLKNVWFCDWTDVRFQRWINVEFQRWNNVEFQRWYNVEYQRWNNVEKNVKIYFKCSSMMHTLCLFILHASVTSITRAHQTPSEWSPFNFKQGTNENTCNSIITDSSLSSHGRFYFSFI